MYGQQNNYAPNYMNTQYGANARPAGPNGYYQNPYPQQYQPMPSIPGRTIRNIDEVRPNEVPSDGSIGIYPQDDYSCIYAKVWGNDGLIKTFKFVPEKQSDEVDIPQPTLAEVMQRLDKIESMLSRRYTKNYRKGENVNE